MTLPVSLESLLFILALLVLVAGYVAWPLADRTLRQPLKEQSGQRAELEGRREQIVVAIRDLDFDYRLGKIAEEDYQSSRARLVADGTAVLKALDTVQATPDGAAPALDHALSEIERAVAAQRKQVQRKAHAQSMSAQGRACPTCGRNAREDEAFCPKCGARLPAGKAA